MQFFDQVSTMGSTRIEHHFISFVEQSKQVKIKIDLTLKLLSAYVYNDCLPKEKSGNFDVSNMLELAELFSLVDTFLTEFHKSLTIELNVDKNKEVKEKKNNEDSKTVIHAAEHENIPCFPNKHCNNGTINEKNIKAVESDIFHKKNHVIDKYNCLENSASGEELCMDGNGYTKKEKTVPYQRNEHVDGEINENIQTNEENISDKGGKNVETVSENVNINQETILPDLCTKKVNAKINEHAQTNEENSASGTCNTFIAENVPVQNSTHRKTTNSGTHTNKTGHTKRESELMFDFDSDSYYSATSLDYTSDASSRSNISGKIANIERKTLLQINKTYKVSIKHVENLNIFFVYVLSSNETTCHATKEFYMEWETMAKFYKRHAKDKAYFLSEDCLDKDCNIFVAVLYKSRWCRGRVLGYHRGVFNLYLIDFGNRIESTIDACRHLKSQFHFPSVLQNVQLNLQYSSSRQALFDALVNDKKVIYEARCVKQVGNSFQVAIQEKGGISINDIIKGTAIGEMDEISTVDAVGAVNDFENTDDGIEDFDPMKEDFYAETNDYNINPDNACQAVIGYIPNDDRRFCKFGKSCRKKKCFRLHQDQDPNGWTKDTETILTKAYETADLPQNELVEIQVISVVNIGEFYAHLERNCEDDDDEEETFESLTEHMNRVANVQAMKKLRTQPARGEILIACYNGFYYRGKVLSFNGENDTCEVFFVDIGVSEYVHLKHLRQMESKYNYLPFQAFHFSVRQHLDFFLPQESEHYDLCLLLFRSLIQFQSFHCVIQSSKTDPADVLLFTKDKVNEVDIVEYYSRCCKRILGEDEESSSDHTSSVSGGSTSVGGLNRKDMTFVPA